MKRPILQAGLIVGALGLGITGCQQTAKKESVSKSKPSDFSLWSEKEVTRDDPDSTGSGLTKSDSLPGTWSKQAQDVEASLGVGNR